MSTIKMFKITKAWLDIHKNKNNKWTKKQAEQLGLDWPLKIRWQRTVIGKFITHKNRVNFQSAANIECKPKMSEIDRCIHYLIENAKEFDLVQYGLLLSLGDMVKESINEESPF